VASDTNQSGDLASKRATHQRRAAFSLAYAALGVILWTAVLRLGGPSWLEVAASFALAAWVGLLTLNATLSAVSLRRASRGE